ncbi:MAG: hypothetical protein GXO19_07035, partial [Epsilonproteobacteria bacterium]|nr:hypothetical protein [Campylobacterota bacterium]NPA57468.1 hypothetical protein [Campylobacterota bacterium]
MKFTPLLKSDSVGTDIFLEPGGYRDDPEKMVVEPYLEGTNLPVHCTYKVYETASGKKRRGYLCSIPETDNLPARLNVYIPVTKSAWCSAYVALNVVDVSTMCNKGRKSRPVSPGEPLIREVGSASVVDEELKIFKSTFENGGKDRYVNVINYTLPRGLRFLTKDRAPDYLKSKAVPIEKTSDEVILEHFGAVGETKPRCKAHVIAPGGHITTIQCIYGDVIPAPDEASSNSNAEVVMPKTRTVLYYEKYYDPDGCIHNEVVAEIRNTCPRIHAKSYPPVHLVTETPDIEVTVDDSQDPVFYGDLYYYTVNVRNIGKADATEKIQLRILLPKDDLDIDHYESPPDWTCSEWEDTGSDGEEKIVIGCDRMGMAKGSSVQFKVYVRGKQKDLTDDFYKKIIPSGKTTFSDITVKAGTCPVQFEDVQNNVDEETTHLEIRDSVDLKVQVFDERDPVTTTDENFMNVVVKCPIEITNKKDRGVKNAILEIYPTKFISNACSKVQCWPGDTWSDKNYDLPFKLENMPSDWSCSVKNNHDRGEDFYIQYIECTIPQLYPNQHLTVDFYVTTSNSSKEDVQNDGYFVLNMARIKHNNEIYPKDNENGELTRIQKGEGGEEGNITNPFISKGVSGGSLEGQESPTVTYNVGDLISYTLKIGADEGATATLTEVEFIDTIPSGLVPVRVDNAPGGFTCSFQGQKLTCKGSNLNISPNSFVEIKYTVRAVQAGRWTNHASLTRWNGEDKDSGDNSTEYTVTVEEGSYQFTIMDQEVEECPAGTELNLTKNYLPNGDFSIVETREAPPKTLLSNGTWYTEAEYVGANKLLEHSDYSYKNTASIWSDEVMKWYNSAYAHRFPGDSKFGMDQGNFLYVNGNDKRDGYYPWISRKLQLDPNYTYLFVAHVSNALGADGDMAGAVDPQIGFFFKEGEKVEELSSTTFTIPKDTVNPSAGNRDIWHRFSYRVKPQSGDISFLIKDSANDLNGDDLIIAGLGVYRCDKVTKNVDPYIKQKIVSVNQRPATSQEPEVTAGDEIVIEAEVGNSNQAE